mmetsp:Transcript_2422/g.4792  ORF Transcript_2422/g.4792 Transcript_2422/m.4792 type:complete len:138 (-) Transcript_2422:354-767(-)
MKQSSILTITTILVVALVALVDIASAALRSRVNNNNPHSDHHVRKRIPAEQDPLLNEVYNFDHLNVLRNNRQGTKTRQRGRKRKMFLQKKVADSNQAKMMKRMKKNKKSNKEFLVAERDTVKTPERRLKKGLQEHDN